MRLVPARSWSLIFASSMLQVACFPIAAPLPPWRSSLSWVALTPMLVALLSPNRGGKPLPIKHAASLGYLAGILFYAGNCYWIYQTMFLYGGLPKPVALLILLLFALYLGLYHALFATLFAALQRLRGGRTAVCLTPFLWVAIELARARITGFPWDLLGNSQIDNLLLLGLAPIGGVMLISFILVAVNAAFVLAFQARGSTRLVATIGTGALAVLLQCGVMLPVPPAAQNATAVLLQENLAVGVPGRQLRPLSLSGELSNFSSLSLQVAQGSPSQTPPSIIVWPEAPSHLQSSDPVFRAAMASLANVAKTALIIGSLGVDFDPRPERGYYLYDSASLFDRDGAMRARYDKIHLVPWGEYIPFKHFFAFANRLTEGVGDMDRGLARTVFVTAGHTYGVFICYESIFGDEVRQFARNGAEVLVNISDDGWYGDTGAPWQHLNMARMRAAENHRWLLRDTNTGVSCVIDPSGRIVSQAPRHQRGAWLFPFAFAPVQNLTLYTRYGDWFAYLCTLTTVLAILLALGKMRYPILTRRH